ncbi:MAG: ABC transporter ATP-binding protein [Treponema sp.]|jgi:simple sugar transport system ATP-binding protein|nr:ABC transporter ATP-binding protein [Treponema sp.]
MAFLEMRRIYKYFGSLCANKDVNLSVEKGEIHALLGENGAGKTTLMNILYGMYNQSGGEIFIDGQPVHIHDPKDAIAKGIGMVHQHFMLIPALTVIENVILGLKKNHIVLDLKGAAESFAAMAGRFGMRIDPWARVDTLTVGQQQRVEILKVLYRKAGILILDEPTAVLTPQEVRSLFGMIRELTKEGLTIIFISHKMPEITAICDRCTIMRDGRVVHTAAVADISGHRELAELMVGRELGPPAGKRAAVTGNAVLEVKNLSCVDSRGVLALSDAGFILRAGEILGVCGVDGNGQSELVRCITGLMPKTAGTVKIDGIDVTNAAPREILNRGVAHIPEDRRTTGIIQSMSVNENLMLMNYRRMDYTRYGFLRQKWIRARHTALCRAYNIKTTGLDEKMTNLSGGNQQKCVIGRELDRQPRLLIAMHPSRGLDVGAARYIQTVIIAARDAGAAVLLVSTELEEIMELSDRILVLYGGRVMDIIDQKDAAAEQLGLLMAGAAPAIGAVS